MTGSRIAGFYRLDVETRRRRLAAAVGLPAHEVAALEHTLPIAVADLLVENAVGTFALPFGVALNFRVNGCDHVVPMVVEEPSVIAAASNAALLARVAGGFVAEADRGAMIGQIQLVGVPRPALAAERLRAARTRLLAAAGGLAPGLCRRGAGPRGLEVRIVQATSGDAMVVVHVLVDTGDAMGANLVNSLVEGLAPLVATIAGGTPCLRIVSNLADQRRARARVRIPLASLTTDDVPGVEVAERVRWAQELAANDPYRAATHNKGIMNGVDAVALATGNDWRSIEAGAHAYAARDGHYRPLSTWTVDDGHLAGTIEMPMATSIVGRLVQSHPQVALALRILNVESARELAMVMVAVGLASNLGALRALVTSGIQRGHMALHARAAGMR
jgi:hydroxymethylglutaryl-CoA reductase